MQDETRKDIQRRKYLLQKALEDIRVQKFELQKECLHPEKDTWLEESSVGPEYDTIVTECKDCGKVWYEYPND